MQPRELIEEWVKRFNKADIIAISELYAENAINHQVVTEPLYGRKAILEMFQIEFGRAKMICNIENIFQDGDWAILEWSDPIGLRGCGFFKIKEGKIVFQRGYFDQLSFFRAQNIPIPDTYLGD
ncbi:MAG: nuclear transport factor 2 family protein [Vicingaceae bacterium]